PMTTAKQLEQRLTDHAARRPALEKAHAQAEAAQQALEEERKALIFAARVEGDRAAQHKLADLTARRDEAAHEAADARTALEQMDAALHDLQGAKKKAEKKQM